MKKNFPITGREQSFGDKANILSTTDLKGAISYVNDDFIAISGFTEDELLRKNHNIVRHPEMPPEAFTDLWSSLKAGRAWMGMVRNRCKNGDHYWVSAFVMPILQKGVVQEYQSVRTQPQRDLVSRATAIYARVLAGNPPVALKIPVVGVRLRLLVGIALAGVMALLGALWLGTPMSIALFTLGPATVLALMLAGWQVQPLSALQEKARAIAVNPLGQYIYTGRRDVFGEIEFALRMLASERGAAVGRVADAATRLATQADHMVSTVQAASGQILRQQAETDQVATAVNQMAASVQEVAHNARSTAEAADRADGNSTHGGQVVASTEDSIRHLAQEVKRATSVIQALEHSSSQISAVLEVIRGIAEQTNLLALNAAIEAARAGEHGRGFAVVADEVRSLATRTQNSTREIQVMIQKLQAGARSSVSVMQQGLHQAEKSVDQAREAAVSLEAISRDVKSITDMSTQIATAVNEQSVVSEEINRSITRIREAADSNARDSRSIEALAVGVAGLASELRLLAAHFWSKKQ
ncbi:methyl-accepting chemotaxis protein [Ectothiorhodospira lacustris]|uniref:methyl-accepting chemotaxis protein n=1 Tax=Ectothiorhodospira lacustris TaxID=2899127 RepID=UPI001EE866AF|nr:PAS domain-containing methyl-accepting chemotaxis protein [Ectothiorhodospira lacustris]MCG5500942.1 methyl-accepting chemotaxis protein [Ectothiorhodospira lacustris]MCG5510695.1 methyl-accepting chemotaxis protein [Ectothiorhodospira lacustris]MCG5522405.1 methyl-accepting chemotaxis protein [Ectothiorhodospira lacustris]